jgi:hypothetical protein
MMDVPVQDQHQSNRMLGNGLGGFNKVMAAFTFCISWTPTTPSG